MGACRDTLVPPAGPPGPDPAHGEAGYTVARYQCTARRADLQCVETEGGAGAAGQPRRIILGSGRVKLTSFNVVYDSVAQTLSADITVQNLRTHPIGTADGTNVAFIKAFFHEGPRVTAYKAPGDTGTVTVANADGTCNCSAANQPYFNYPEILQPNQISAVKNWRWHIPPTVNTFAFVLYVFTRYPGEVDIAATPPDTVPSSLYDASKVVKGDTSDSGWFLRDVVLMGFRPGTSAEDRLAAVNWTNGTVVGGMRIGSGGIYFVRVPDDGTGAPLRLALSRLARLPQVAPAGSTWSLPG